MLDVFKDILSNIVQASINDIVDETSDRINEKVDLIVAKMAAMMREVVPALVFSSLFYGVGMILFVFGLGSFLDTIVGLKGAGAMVGGVVLIFLGLYYKMQFEKALARMEQK
ncbi:MAG: hypothetical protein PHQ80_02870 [Candidatus ainarchaeum sp.]|nr:hypothetical protein [Candidatus ainarchaeum sp.]MDD5096405.1 hypothetical protein [Candidatus ainarchaeum sp.]